MECFALRVQTEEEDGGWSLWTKKRCLRSFAGRKDVLRILLGKNSYSKCFHASLRCVDTFILILLCQRCNSCRRTKQYWSFCALFWIIMVWRDLNNYRTFHIRSWFIGAACKDGNKVEDEQLFEHMAFSSGQKNPLLAWVEILGIQTLTSWPGRTSSFFFLKHQRPAPSLLFYSHKTATFYKRLEKSAWFSTIYLYSNASNLR